MPITRSMNPLRACRLVNGGTAIPRCSNSALYSHTKSGGGGKQGQAFAREKRRRIAQRKPKVLRQEAENHGAFTPCELAAHARPGAAAKGKVGELRQRLAEGRRPAAGHERFRLPVP